MENTAAQVKVDRLQAQVDQDQQTLSNDQAALEEAKKELAFASLVNQLEALSADQIDTLNAALKEDSNALGISISIPSAAGPQA